jgi:hypothetical protein
MVEGQWDSPDHALRRFQNPAQLTRREGKAVVRRAHRLLEKYHGTYKVGLIDKCECDHFSSFWKVLSGQAVLLETWRDDNGDEVDFVIENTRVVSDYLEDFDRLWRQLSSEGRDQRKVAAWLRDVLEGA